MKRIERLLIAVVAVLAGVAGAQSQAQDISPRHVYFAEGFSSEGTRYDSAVWNLEADTGYRRLYFSTGIETGCPSPEAVWGYWPDAGADVVLRDTLRLVSKAFDYQKASRAYVSMKYRYKAKGNSADGVRSFGLAARQPGGDWIPCGVVGEGGLKMLIGPDQLLAELPTGLKDAPQVEVCVYLQNKIDIASLKSNYLLYFDDIEFYAYPEAYHDLAFSWMGRSYVFIGDEADAPAVGLQMENIGNTLKSGKIAYTFDNGATQYIDLTFEEPLLPGQTYTATDFVPEGWAEASEGHHAVVFWLAEADGVALAETAIVKHRKTLSKLNQATATTYSCRPLVEGFSSSSCVTCASRNKTLQPIFDALGDSISVIKYQMNFPGNGDPYYTGDGGLRGFFYHVQNIPALYLNGDENKGSGTNSVLARLRENINAPACFDISFDTLALDADTNVYAVFRVRTSASMDGVLHTAVIEGTTEGNASTNGETEFHHVMLKMLPDANGLPVSLKPDTVYTFRFAYDMKKTFMEEADDLKVVCFLQTGNDTVLQSAIGDVDMRIDAVPGSGTANERTEAYTALAVYPNPVSVEVTLPALDRATVEVFNMAGRRVFHRYGVQGDYRLDVRNFRPGVYVIRVVETGRTAWAKISVVR